MFINSVIAHIDMAGRCFMSGQGLCNDSEVVPVGECKADVSGHTVTLITVHDDSRLRHGTNTCGLHRKYP
jgi:hypothetical protein